MSRSPSSRVAGGTKPSMERARWYRALFSVRTRLLLWHILLTAGAALIAVKTTNEFYRDRLKARTESSVRQQVEQFSVLIEKQRWKGVYAPESTAELFDRLLSTYVPTRNEYVLMLSNDQVYKTHPDLPSDLLKPHPDLVQRWSQTMYRQLDCVYTPKHRLFYAAEPVYWMGDRATLVVLYDGTSDFRLEKEALVSVMRFMLAFLAVFFILAWITAGRVLSPLRLLTKTAHSITESDMTQRIPVQGKDEIAELTATFNDMLDRLQFAFDSQKDFLKDASHELRTPITVIQGHLEMLAYCPEKQSETLALVVDELERMGRLVNDLLLLAKAEHPKFLNLKPEELDWLTEELYLKARSMAQRDWRLESKGLSPITVDRQRLTQAIMNLVQNAIRHTQPDDVITIGSSVKEDYAYIWVRDTGEGIAPEDQDRIFHRFVRATQRNHQFEGYGLGLAIVQAIAQAHDGWVELTSELGHGSTFTLVIPLIPHSSATTDESDSYHRRQPSHQRLSRNWFTSSRLHDHHR
jgi:signal transduction histidine kinase